MNHLVPSEGIYLIIIIIILCYATTHGQDHHPEYHSSHHHLPHNSSRYCTEEDFKYGQWVPGSKRCGLRNSYEGADGRPPAPLAPADLCWEPLNCVQHIFSPYNFCRKLNGRNILIVGDSINHQLYYALFYQLNSSLPRLEERPVHFVYPQKNNNVGMVCEKTPWPARLMYIRNDHISVNNPAPFSNTSQPSDRDWRPIVDDYEIIILNKGAHYREPLESMKLTRETAEFLRQYYFKNNTTTNKYVIFRTTYSGHASCNQNSQPDTHPLNTTPSFPPWNPKDRSYHKYVELWHWDKLYSTNNYTIETFLSILPAQYFRVLNIAEMTALRPDGHICSPGAVCDCLHYRMPSVPDSWVNVLYNIMPHPDPKQTRLLEE